MGKFIFFCALAVCSFSITGCGGSGQNTDVAANADAQAIADYEAEEKARAAAMQANQPGN